jgi:hypothetical protein
LPAALRARIVILAFTGVCRLSERRTRASAALLRGSANEAVRPAARVDLFPAKLAAEPARAVTTTVERSLLCTLTMSACWFRMCCTAAARTASCGGV